MMGSNERKKTYLSQERIKMLMKGQAVNITQNGHRQVLIPIVDCCISMKEQRSTRKGRRLASTWKQCPWCGKNVIVSGDENGHSPVHIKISNALKGRKRIKGPDGKIHWSPRV